MEKITLNKGKNFTEIIINGNLNIHSIDQFNVSFRDIISSGTETKTIVINCGKINSIDSSGLGMLISFSKQAEKNGIAFYLYELNKRASTLFDISNLDKYFRIISKDEFIDIAGL